MLDISTYDTGATVDSPIGASQLELEQLYSKYQLMPAIKQEFINEGFVPQMEELGIPGDFGLGLLCMLYLHKRVEPGSLIGMLLHHFSDESNPAQACANMIMRACEVDLCNFDPLANQVIVIYQITEDVQAKIDQFQYPLPMIEQPSPVTNNKQTGYRTIRKSILLKKNHHDDDVCLDHINRMNRQPLSVNPSVVAFVQNSWADLDHKKTGETDEEFAARKRAFEKYDIASRDVLEALMTQEDPTFYLTHAYDKRGRTYAQGYHVSYQGNDWNKACVQFGRAEALSEYLNNTSTDKFLLE